MKRLLPIRICLLLVYAFILSCGHSSDNTLEIPQNETTIPGSQFGFNANHLKEKSHNFPSPRNISPLDFLQAVQMKGNKRGPINIVTFQNDFPQNWITTNHVDTLIKMLDSKVRCNCYLNPNSSLIPTDSADLGGYAIVMLQAYRQGKPLDLGLYACPKTNTQMVASLKSWWANDQQ